MAKFGYRRKPFATSFYLIHDRGVYWFGQCSKSVSRFGKMSVKLTRLESQIYKSLLDYPWVINYPTNVDSKCFFVFLKKIYIYLNYLCINDVNILADYTSLIFLAGCYNCIIHYSCFSLEFPALRPSWEWSKFPIALCWKYLWFIPGLGFSESAPILGEW